MADGATSALDGSTSDDGAPWPTSEFDGSGCMVQWGEDFETGIPTTSPWGSTDSAGTNAALTADGMGAPPVGKSIKAHIDLGVSPVAHSWIPASANLTTPLPSAIALEYSVYLGDAFSQSGFYSEMGCMMNIGGDDLYFKKEHGGSFTTTYGQAFQTLPNIVIAKQWLDLRYVISRAAGSQPQIIVSVRPHGADASAWQSVTLNGINMTTAPAVTVRCGVYDAEAMPSTPTIDVWVDNVSFSTCP
jgi:hypothetical protein